MVINKAGSILIFIGLLILGGWFYKKYRTVPLLPAYENTITNESGETIKISAFKGRHVLISYFQTWCGDCIKELPSIDNLQNKIGKEKLIVLMVSDETTKKINRFKEKYCSTLEYYQTKKTMNEIGIHVFPTTYLLNENGEVILSKLEGFDWSDDEIVNLIN